MARTNTRLGMLFVPLLAGALSVGCGSDDPAPDPQPGEQPRGAAADPLAALVAAEARPVVLDGRAVVLTGSPGGAYYELARQLKVAGDERAPALIETAGSLETLQLLAFGRGDLGLVQGDVLRDPGLRSLRAALATSATPLFNEEIRVLVGSEGPATLLALAGSKVGVGASGSGSATSAANLFWAAGVFDVELVPGELATNLELLASGQLSALVVVGAEPLLGLRGAKLRVLDLGEERDAIVAALQKTDPSYLAADLGETKTVAVSSFLVRRAGFEGEVDLSEARASIHPAAQTVTNASVELPASNEGPSLSIRDPELPLRLVGEDLRALGLLARAWTGDGAEIRTAQASALTALALLSSGQAEAALVQEDLLLEALARPETARIAARYRIAAPLYPVGVYLVQKSEGELSDAASLRGKDLAIGAPASALGASARRILRQLRVLPEHFTGHLKGDGALAWFREGLPSEGEAALVLGELPGYAGLETGGVGTRCLLVVRRELPEEQVQALVAALYANRKNLAGDDERFGALDPAALDGLPTGLELHAGTVAAKDAGLSPDSADPWE